MINAKDVLELRSRKRETANESSGSGSGGGSSSGNIIVALKQASFDDDGNQTQSHQPPMSYDQSVSSANTSSMEIGSSSSGSKDMERSLAAPIHYSHVEVVDVRNSGDCISNERTGASNESDMHQMSMQQMTTTSENQNVPDQTTMLLNPVHDNSQAPMISQSDGSHNVPPQNQMAHNSNNVGQSIITHNDQLVTGATITPSQTIISPNEHFPSQETPGK